MGREGNAMARWNNLVDACAHLSAARNLLDPDQTTRTVEELIDLFSAPDLMPRMGRHMALHLTAWDLKLYEAPTRQESRT